MKNVTRTTAVALGLFCVIWTLTGCGGGGSGAGGGNCGKVAACGGAIAGTWKVAGGCVNQASLSAQVSLAINCPTVTAAISNLTASGSLTFGTDGTYSAAGFMESFTTTANLPAACLSSAQACSTLDAAFKAQVGNDSVVSATCKMAGTGCACTLLSNFTLTETGTYTSAGNTLMASGELAGGDYCVDGKTLHLVELDTTMNMGPMGTATITSDTTATKQ